MQIIVANTAGFCFGVDRAVEQVYKSLEQAPLYTYGPIIHNHQVVADMEAKGVKVINGIDELDQIEVGTMIIRSHGIGRGEFEQIETKGFKVIDATCPYVKRIHKIVKDASDAGQQIIIIGSSDHPEVSGIKGWSTTKTHVVETLEDIDRQAWDPDVSYCLVTQTTFNHLKYKELLNKLQSLGIRVMIYETICNATQNRQEEAVEIAKKATKMIVIGGWHSSNTQKLYNICKNQCDNTYHIETIEDLVLNVFADDDIIGITAGASTPKHIIEEVISNVRRTKF